MDKWIHPALRLIKEKGIFGLCYSDGCVCCRFAVHHVNVEVSCRKSSVSLPYDADNRLPVVRVHGGGDLDDFGLLEIANEIVRQISGDAVIRLCSYEDDKEVRCIYCHEPRENAESIYCNKHSKGINNG